jgi:prepilin-type N-terminal cleavage/methylation domain-containing protein
MMRTRPRAGVTLMELLIAVTLLSLLSVGLLYALRIGVISYSRTQTKLMDNRRVAGAQRILEQQLQGMIPVSGAGGVIFFQGESQTMRLVSAFSLQDAWRGLPQILEVFVAPGEQGGVRLLVNEIPYQGPRAALALCPTPNHCGSAGQSERSFVLADRLAYCRFTYLNLVADDIAPIWGPAFASRTWPKAIHIEMAPLVPDASHLQAISTTAVIRIHRNPEIPYGDF